MVVRFQPLRLFPVVPRPQAPSCLLYTSAKVKVGPLEVEVLHTPGHTPGSVTLNVEGVLFTGDTLFRGSMGRTDLPGGSYSQLMASLKKLAALPSDYKVYPGHEGPTTLEQERQTNYYMREAMES